MIPRGKATGMKKQAMHETNFYEMWSSIYTLEALLESSPDQTIKSGNQKMWRILWDDASAKITTYLHRSPMYDGSEESLTGEMLAAERSKLHKEIQKISTFNTEAGEALWKNSAARYMVSTNIRFLVHALRTYLEQERRLMMPQKGAAV
jgi:hypothetical protein